MDQVIALYKEEIATYQQQIEDLKRRNRDCDQKNAALINKIQNLEDLVEKANIANRDLNIAFEHVHQENLRHQVSANNQEALVANNNKQVAETNTRKEELTTESLVWISEREQFKQRNKFLERECERYHRDNMHLGKQVRHLLKTLEEERGIIIRRQSQVTEDNNQITCAADVIDKHLITFESIEELQQQNQKLLSLVKNLSAEQEEREVRVESEEVKRLTADIEELKSQLETVKNDRERVLNALNTIHKERDLFKILLCKTRQVEHLTPEIFQRMVAVACSSGPAIAGPDSSSAERESHIEDLKRMISNLERNIESIKKELDDSQAASAAELKVKNQLLEKAHLKISEVMKTLEAANERNQLLESNIKALTLEFDDIRTKCQKMTLELEESNKKIENAENHTKEFAMSLDVERKRAQEALIEASQYKEQSQQLLEALEREKHYRQQELANLFKELQDKQIREFEARAEKQMELQQLLNRAHNDVFNMQLQRNFERERRIKLDKLINGRPKVENGRQERRGPNFKRTKKRRQVRFSFVDANSSYISPNNSYKEPNSSFKDSNNSYKDPSSSSKEPKSSYEETNISYSEPNNSYKEASSSCKDTNSSFKAPNDCYNESTASHKPLNDSYMDQQQQLNQIHDHQELQPQQQQQEQQQQGEMESENDNQHHESEPEPEFVTLEGNNPQEYEIVTETDNLDNHMDEDQNLNSSAKSGFIKLKRRKFD